MTIPRRPLFTPTDELPTFVLDVGVSCAWLPGTSHEIYPGDVLTRIIRDVPLVPITWPADMVAWVRSADQSGSVTRTKAESLLAGFDVVRFAIDDRRLNVTWPAVLAVARRCRLRVGPAAALELALRSHLPLATVDPRLRTAAVRAGVALFAP